MENKIYHLVDKKAGVHEYNLTVTVDDEKVTHYSLYYSNAEHWSQHTKGTLAFHMIDHGDGMKFDSKLKKLDYSQVEYIRIILEFANRTANIPCKYTVVEGNGIMEI